MVYIPQDCSRFASSSLPYTFFVFIFAKRCLLKLLGNRHHPKGKEYQARGIISLWLVKWTCVSQYPLYLKLAMSIWIKVFPTLHTAGKTIESSNTFGCEIAKNIASSLDYWSKTECMKWSAVDYTTSLLTQDPSLNKNSVMKLYSADIDTLLVHFEHNKLICFRLRALKKIIGKDEWLNQFWRDYSVDVNCH